MHAGLPHTITRKIYGTSRPAGREPGYSCAEHGAWNGRLRSLCWNLYKPLKCFFKKKKPHTQKSKSCSSYFSSYSVRFTHLRVPAFQKALTASGLGDLSLLLLVWLSVSGHPCHQQPDLSSFLAFLPPNSLPL